VKAHYNGQRLSSQILLFKTTCFWTSTKLILKWLSTNHTWNEVVQNPKNKIVKKNSTLKLISNDWKIYKWKNCNCIDILQSENILQKPFKQLPNLMKYSIIYYIGVHCPISILYEAFHSCDFTKNIWIRFFIQTSVNVWIHESFLKKIIIWKITRIVRGDLCQKFIFSVFQNVKWNLKNAFPK
jgi:hypothetical protein